MRRLNLYDLTALSRPVTLLALQRLAASRGAGPQLSQPGRSGMSELRRPVTSEGRIRPGRGAPLEKVPSLVAQAMTAAHQEMIDGIPVIRNRNFFDDERERIEQGAWYEWKRYPPKEAGLYVWRGLDGAPVSVVVHRRPTAHAPGGQLNGTALGNPGHFYNGCAVSDWQGFWIGPLPDLPERGE